MLIELDGLIRDWLMRHQVITDIEHYRSACHNIVLS